MRSPINVLKPQPVLLLIQYCLRPLQSIARDLGHGRGSRLLTAAVIVQTPHNRLDLVFSPRFERARFQTSRVHRAGSVPIGARRGNTLSSRRKAEELLKSSRIGSLRFLPYSVIWYPAADAWCVNENIWSVRVSEQMRVRVHNDTNPLGPCQIFSL